ncbi:hypothetical protein C8F04DRAFT_1194418 [Mycena alexandri]|uniref:Uncharacterized protein n=1 Tax=Mycena alexandri TaxID=1745969 RepID=A0AAD6WRG6_9AGAR|nr:hypothetical protein C8F04DRAFT_1194418 [Mycena alexandri]
MPLRQKRLDACPNGLSIRSQSTPALLRRISTRFSVWVKCSSRSSPRPTTCGVRLLVVLLMLTPLVLEATLSPAQALHRPEVNFHWRSHRRLRHFHLEQYSALPDALIVANVRLRGPPPIALPADLDLDQDGRRDFSVRVKKKKNRRLKHLLPSRTTTYRPSPFYARRYQSLMCSSLHQFSFGLHFQAASSPAEALPPCAVRGYCRRPPCEVLAHFFVDVVADDVEEYILPPKGSRAVTPVYSKRRQKTRLLGRRTGASLGTYALQWADARRTLSGRCAGAGRALGGR